jgi:CheY-like chemotaxis protein
MEDKTILVVDDDASARIYVTEALRHEGYLVSAAESGEAALSILESTAPDLVLLDIEMPGMSGYDLLEALRASPATTRLPVIFLTVRDTTEDQKRGLKEGVVDYLSKEVLTPDKVAVLLYRLRNFFSWQEIERLRGVLATIVSANHEINNPLMVVQGGADLIRIKGLLQDQPDGLKALDRITSACRNIKGVLDRISGLSEWAGTTYLPGVEMLDLKRSADLKEATGGKE